MDTPQRPAIYCRLSYSPAGDLEKVERQEADCRQLAARLGWPVCCIYVDNARSAWQRDRRRPGWDAMLDTLRPEAGHTHDSIITYHGDRLNRQPYDLELLLRLADDRHLSLASVSGVRDLSSADDRFILRIEAAQACKASDDTSRRVRRGWEARAKRGEPSGGGKRPFGFADLTTPDPAESAILAEAAARVLGGEPLNSVVAWMNTCSTTTSGNAWTPRSLKNLLVAPRIAGLVAHGGNLYNAVWEPIISRGEWEDIGVLLERNAQMWPHQGRQPRYLLSRIAICGMCEAGLRTKPSGGRNRKTKRLYCCVQPGCRKLGRDQRHLDEYVTGRVIRRLSESDLMDEIDPGVDDGTAAEITALQIRRRQSAEQLETLANHPSVSADMVVQALESFDAKIAHLQQAREVNTRARLLARMKGITRQQWDEQPLELRRQTVRALYRVTVHHTSKRGPGFDASAIELQRVTG